jgi:hypothetical protein
MKSFTASITAHLRKQGLDHVVLDLRGLADEQAALVDQYISTLSSADQSRLLLFK